MSVLTPKCALIVATSAYGRLYLKHKRLYSKYMRVFCLFRPNTDTERSVIELTAEMKRRYNQELECISVDTKEGAQLARVYDILQFPAVVATDSNGAVQKTWDDGSLPLMNELSYYLNQ